MRISVYNGLAGTDYVAGTSDADEIYVRRSEVTVESYAGNDYIEMINDGDGIVNAGAGDDSIRVEGKYMTVSGGTGADVITLYNSYANADGGAGDDKINVSGLLNQINHVTLAGGAGNDLFKFDPTGANSSDPSKPKGNTIDVTITDLSNGDTLRNGYVGNIGLEYSQADGNIILTEPGQGELNITVKGVSDISQISNVVYRTKNETKTLGEIFEPSSSSGSGEIEIVLPNNSTSDSSTNNSSNNGGNGTTIINNYGDTYNFNNNNGAVVIGSNVEGGVTNNTNIDNSKNIVISGNTWTYSGGDKVINNYQQGEVIRLDSDYQGIDLNGNSFFVKSSSGSLEIQNSRDKFIGYSAGNDDVAVYSYVAGMSGAVDGRGKSQVEMMIGAENSDNQIYAGDGGSSVWGGVGGNDQLYGGAGYDEFFYFNGCGNDVIQNAGDNDIVNLAGVSLSQISYAEVHQSEINIGFNDGGNLKVQGQSATGFMLEGVTYTADRSTGGWRMK
ncbi:MAG: hypothetical protein IJQ16_08190 [Selenomonadaceae bacterium]|nr:hypothetical protein [Selenomonadaceae bacterium]